MSSGIKSNSKKTAFCAMMAALGTVIMLTGGLVSVFTYCSPLISALLLIPVLDLHGTLYAWMVWFVTAALSMIIGVDKEASFFYAFLGWYPILKPVFDRVHGKLPRILAKAAVFSVSVCAMYGLTCFVFRIGDIVDSFSASHWINIAFLVCLVIVMLLYDRVLLIMSVLWRLKLKPKLIKDDVKRTKHY